MTTENTIESTATYSTCCVVVFLQAIHRRLVHTTHCSVQIHYRIQTTRHTDAMDYKQTKENTIPLPQFVPIVSSLPVSLFYLYCSTWSIHSRSPTPPSTHSHVHRYTQIHIHVHIHTQRLNSWCWLRSPWWQRLIVFGRRRPILSQKSATLRFGKKGSRGRKQAAR